MRKRDLLGYGVASVADSAPYNFATIYLILFWTTVVGLSPERAGTISSIIILADGFGGVLLGYISDNTKSKYGRRRPYLLASVVPLVLGLMFLFCKVPAGEAVQTAFYIIVGFMFWLGFTMYYTPYTALGAELTDDYNERSILRTYARLFGIGGNFIAMVVPLVVVQFLVGHGFSEGSSWFTMATGLAAISGAGILITWKSTKGKERPAEHIEDKISLSKLAIEYFKILKLKPFKYMIAVIAFFIIGNTFYNSSMVFFARYSLGLGDEVTSSIFLISIIANLAYTPIMGVGAVKFGKKNVLGVSMLISGIGGVAFFIIGIHSYLGMAVYACIFSVAYTCFWQLINAIMYDISEVADYEHGKRMEGSIASVYGLVFTIFTSIATQVFGWVLKLEFFSGAFLLIPGLLLIAAAIAQFIYPINEKTFNLLKQALVDKKAGNPVNLDGLNRIIL